MATSNQYDVFISYSRANLDWTRELYGHLKPKCRVFFDRVELKTGAQWSQAITQAIQDCKIFVLIVSKASMASDDVYNEINLAASVFKCKKIIILPFVIDDWEINSTPEKLYHLGKFQITNISEYSRSEQLEIIEQAICSNLYSMPEMRSGEKGHVIDEFVRKFNSVNQDLLQSTNTALRYFSWGCNNFFQIFLPLSFGPHMSEIIVRYDETSLKGCFKVSGKSNPHKDISSNLLDTVFKKYGCFHQGSGKLESHIFFNYEKINTPFEPKSNQDMEKDIVRLADSLFSKVVRLMQPHIVHANAVNDVINAQNDVMKSRLEILFPPDSWTIKPMGSFSGFKIGHHLLQNNVKLKGLLNANEDNLFSLRIEADTSALSTIKISLTKADQAVNLSEIEGTVIACCKTKLGDGTTSGDVIFAKSLPPPYNDANYWSPKTVETWATENLYGEFKNSIIRELEKWKPVYEELLKKPVSIPKSEVMPSDGIGWDVNERAYLRVRMAELFASGRLGDTTTNLDTFVDSNSARIVFRHRFGDFALLGEAHLFNAKLQFMFTRGECCPDPFAGMMTNLRNKYFSAGLTMAKQNGEVFLIDSIPLNPTFEITIKDRFDRFEAEAVQRMPKMLELTQLFDTHLKTGVDLMKRAEERLKAIFPEKDGWLIQNTLESLKEQSSIQITNGYWGVQSPISFVLESRDHAINNLCVGIVHEPAFSEILTNETAKQLFNQLVVACIPELKAEGNGNYFPQTEYLKETGFCPLRKDGTTLADQADQFIGQVVNYFEKLKLLTPAIDLLAQSPPH